MKMSHKTLENCYGYLFTILSYFLYEKMNGVTITNGDNGLNRELFKDAQFLIVHSHLGVNFQGYMIL